MWAEFGIVSNALYCHQVSNFSNVSNVSIVSNIAVGSNVSVVSKCSIANKAQWYFKKKNHDQLVRVEIAWNWVADHQLNSSKHKQWKTIV